ncbi:hypothetical protein KJ855_03175 [Patescibacteria group bacterium]|nr:hypothetical protein [Patescibacteria group bacterium]
MFDEIGKPKRFPIQRRKKELEDDKLLKMLAPFDKSDKSDKMDKRVYEPVKERKDVASDRCVRDWMNHEMEPVHHSEYYTPRRHYMLWEDGVTKEEIKKISKNTDLPLKDSLVLIKEVIERGGNDKRS